MKHKCLLITFLAAGAAACSTSLGEDSGDASAVSRLTLSVRTGLPESRSMITGTSLEAGDEIGVTLTDEQGNSYDGLQYSNIRFQAAGTSSSQSWDAESEVMLSASKGTLYAYYPYSAEVTDIRSIPVFSDSQVQTDYMYAEPVTGLNNRNTEAPVSLKHALAAVRISLKRGNYTGMGNITALSISGDNMATEGSLNAMDGTISAISGSGDAISPSISPTTLQTEGTYFDILAIPTGRETSIDIEIVMDGETFNVTTDAAALSKGMISVFDIEVNNSSVSIAPVKVKAWGYSQKMNSTLQKNWEVTLNGDTADMNIDSSVESDGSVRIIASPVYPEAEINPAEISGSCTCSQSIINGVRTILLSDISSDVSIDFNSYGLWVTAVYNITSNTAETQLVSSSSGCTRMQIDGAEVTAACSQLFGSTGEHTVKMMFPDKEKIPVNAFNYISNVRSISIPEGVKELGTRCMSGCSSLTSVQIPQTVVSSSYEVFSNCSSLKSVVLPDNLEMGYGMFASCYNIEEVILPKNLKNLRTSTFYRCYKLTKCDIPESVTVIEDNAFESCGLTAVTLPTGLKSIGNYAFNICSSLNSIRYTDGTDCSSELILREGLESVGKYAFNRCRALTAVHIPASLTKIGDAAFTSENIQSMTVAEGNTVYKTVSGFTGIIESNSGTLICGACNSTVMPSEVTRIGNGAFSYLPVSSIDLHDKITYIGNEAFYSNTNKKLNTIISRSVNPPEVGKSSVFYGCLTGGSLMVPASAVEVYKSSSWMSTSYGFLGALGWSVTALKE